MERNDILSSLDDLNPEEKQISQALAFLRLVVENNPKKTAEQIRVRPDVQQALEIINRWISDVGELVDEVIKIVPKQAVKDITKSVDKTLSSFEAEISISDQRLGEWRDGSESSEAWAAKIILRMSWLIDWIRAQVEGLTLGAPYKRWNCRMSPNSCVYCRGLNGVVLPAGKSFKTEAKKLGFTRIYGGLFGPKLHPRCMCYLTPVSQEEFDSLTDTKK